MKFGKTLISHQIPQWLTYYLNYKKLKKLIKNIDRVTDYERAENNQLSQVPDLINDTLSNFYVSLNESIEVVDQFFNAKFFEYNKRLARVVELLNYQETPAGATISLEVIDNQLELNEILANLVELKGKVHNLKWFGNLNNKAIIKILKKLDKKLSVLINLDIDAEVALQNNNKQVYVSKKFNELPFANQQSLDKLLELIKNVIQLLGNQEVPSNIDSATIDRIQLNDGSLTADLFDGSTQKLILTYLLNAVISNAPNSIDFIFQYLVDKFPELPLLNKLDLNNRNFFHKLMVYLGDIGDKEFPVVGPSNLSFDSVFPKFIKHNLEDTSAFPLNPRFLNALKGLNYFLSQINTPELRSELMAKDNYLKTCIHYTSQYGLKDFIRLLFHYIVDEWSIRLTSMDNLEFWNDKESLTPLHLSIISNNPVTTKFLILYSNSVHHLVKCSNLLLLAVRLNCDSEIINDLLYLGDIKIDYTDAEHNYETALYIATKHNYLESVEYLLENGSDTEIPERVFGWTPIFIASAEGYEGIVKLLLQYDAKFSFTDDSGWLPMEHATLRGHLKISDLLRPENADILLYDINNPQNNVTRMKASSSYIIDESSGNEHASVLPGAMSTSSIDKLPESSKVALAEVYKQLKSNANQPSVSRSKSPNNRRKKLKPVKSFGHKYLNEGESVVLITLGTTDLRDTTEAIQLNKPNLMKSFNIELDIALSLSIMPVNQKTGELLAVSPVIIDLPLDEAHGVASDPITFKFTKGLKLEEIVVTFDLVPTYQIVNTTISNSANGASSPVLGRAVALLLNCYTRIGRHMRSLNSKITLPIVESMSLNVLGTINFEFLFVEPFSHPLMKTDRSGTYWKKLVSTRVIGHRGLGKNEVNRKSLQLGENTVESFIAAASLGASYVEFDVQLTKDFVPVVYHDFTVAESGVDIPMHALTAEQFLHLSDNNLHQKKKRVTVDDTHIDSRQPFVVSRPASPTIYSESSSLEEPVALTSANIEQSGLDYSTRNGNGLAAKARGLSGYRSSPGFFSHHRANDEPEETNDEIDQEFRDQFNFRMKLTKTWKDKGFKGNARGFSIASNFVTLRELFRKLPKNVGFNIELKYPMLDEAQHEDMGEIAIDLNYYIDTILKVIYEENTSNRDILFSSFHPDICVLLLLKQPSMPILFLTEAGTEFMADIRASSLQNAIRFAKNWNLLGIVSAAGALVRTPRLTQVVKSSGLVCVTYGVENNDPELVKIQMRSGVDAVIADSVLAVRDGLRSDELTLKGLEDSSGSEEH